MKRRDFVKGIVLASGIVGITPFIPAGKFLVTTFSFKYVRQKIANVNDIPPNNRLLFTYPKTGDIEQDSDPFRKFLLIRLPNGEFKAYSAVCLHLWCIIDYKPDKVDIECPCHGSTYNAQTGVAFKGPASKQFNKTLPEVKLEIDDNGDIYANGVIGVIGYGREGA